MSRIGKQPVAIPDGVEVTLGGDFITAKGPKGAMKLPLPSTVSLNKADSSIHVSCVGNTKQAKCNFGTSRALIANMIKGVKSGWTRKLLLNGVGYQAKQNGSVLTLACGYSHDVVLNVPEDVQCKAAGTSIELESVNRELLGTFAAKIRNVAPPEPYLGKGIRYDDETVRRKAGKTGKGK